MMTARQRAVLELIRPGQPLCYGGSHANHWFFHGGVGPKILAGTGWSLLHHKWIRALPRRMDQPFWLTEYILTDAGREALTTGRNLRIEK
jgi:hypothetical protein